MTFYDILCSGWRTLVPLIAGWLAALLARVYIDIDQQTLAQGLVALFAIAYYALFRFLEAKVHPSFGWLLGLARPPAYKTPDPTQTPWGKPPTGTAT